MTSKPTNSLKVARTEKDFENSLVYWRDLAKMLRAEVIRLQKALDARVPDVSDEGIESEAHNQSEYAGFSAFEYECFIRGARWMRERMKNG